MITGDEIVAEYILSEMLAQGIISAPTLEKIKRKLAAGVLTATDWQLEFEKAIHEQEKLNEK